MTVEQRIEPDETAGMKADIERLRGLVAKKDTQLSQIPCRHNRCVEFAEAKAEIERLKDALVIANTTTANLHSEIKKLRIQITDDLSTAYEQQAEIKKLKDDNRIITAALENMHMTESETVEELRNELAIREKEWKATQGLRELLSEDDDGSCKSCDKLADKIIELDADKLRLEAEAKAEIARLRGEVTKYKARIQLMRGYMWSYSGSGTTLWRDFLRVKPEAAEWFDQDGVPI